MTTTAVAIEIRNEFMWRKQMCHGLKWIVMERIKIEYLQLVALLRFVHFSSQQSAVCTALHSFAYCRRRCALWLIKDFVLLCAQLATIKFNLNLNVRATKAKIVWETTMSFFAFEWRQLWYTNNSNANQCNELSKCHQTIKIFVRLHSHSLSLSFSFIFFSAFIISRDLRFALAQKNSTNVTVHWQQTHHFHFARNSFSFYLIFFFVWFERRIMAQFLYFTRCCWLCDVTPTRLWAWACSSFPFRIEILANPIEKYCILHLLYFHELIDILISIK